MSGYDDYTNSLNTLQRLGNQPGQMNALADIPSADAWQYNRQSIADWIAQQRAISASQGLWSNGGPTNAGARDAAQQLAMSTVFGTFGGQRAATADLGKLAEARSLASKGVGRDDILSQTGWFRGPDGHWRFEISDQGMTVNPRSGETDRKSVV